MEKSFEQQLRESIAELSRELVSVKSENETLKKEIIRLHWMLEEQD